MGEPAFDDDRVLPTGEAESGRSLPPGFRVPPEHRRASAAAGPLHPPGAGRPPVMWCMGAVGGSGASTLARSWAPAADAGLLWPVHDRYPNVIVCARTDMNGLTAAHDRVLEAAGGLIGRCRLLGVVTVADIPVKLSTALSNRVENIEEALAATAPGAGYWHIPYLPQHRITALDRLPVWDPREEPPTPERHRLRRNATVPTAVDPGLAAVGAAVFAAARAASRPSHPDPQHPSPKGPPS